MKRYARLLGREGGFTLAESLIAIGIITVALTMVGMPMINVLRHDEDWRASITATTTLQRTTTAVAKDSINAYTVSVDDGGPPVDTITFAWDDLGGTPHTAVYTLDGTNLVRDFDGETLIVGRNVSLVAFSRSANLLTFTIDVDAGEGATDSKTSSHFLRSLQ